MEAHKHRLDEGVVQEYGAHANYLLYTQDSFGQQSQYANMAMSTRTRRMIPPCEPSCHDGR